jgi:isochorismate synthase
MNGHSVLRETPAKPFRTLRLAESATRADLDLFAAAERASALSERFFFWQSPDRTKTIFGAGELLRLTADGDGRFPDISFEWRSLDLSDAPGALLLGGFSFADEAPRGAFGDLHAADLFVPRVLARKEHGTFHLSLFTLLDGTPPDFTQAQALLGALMEDPGSAPPPRVRIVDPPGARQAWQRRVLAATGAISEGAFEKVVLARRRIALYLRRPAISSILRALSRREADCRIFAYGDGHRVFLGATPELLCLREDGVARVDCLAGSSRRDRDPATDRAIGDALRASGKNRGEHAHVVRAVQTALEGLGLTPTAPAEPAVRHFHHLQHLYTPVSAVCGPEHDVFRLAGALHPTPAVGGAPQADALAWLRSNEGLNRGLYAGAIGWADSQGDGEFDVGLRSALFLRRSARLFAGCGIVSESQPDEEFQETELKLRPIESALREDG